MTGSRPSPKCDGKARKGKWEEIQFEFRLSDTQKGSFLGEKRKYRRWKCEMGNFSQNTTKIGGYLHENLEKPIPHSGNFSPTFVEDNKVVVGLGTFPHLHTFLGRLSYKHWSDLPLVHAGTDKL